MNSARNARIALHVIFVAGPVGVMVGLAISAYDYLVNTLLWDNFSTLLSPELLCLMPLVGMILTGLILHLGNVKSASMADAVVDAYHNSETGIELRSALPKFAASITTMAFGCSAGMEGASKWLGAAIAAWFQLQINRRRWAKLLHGKVELTMLAGAAAGISAIFRAPLTGAVMGIESPYKKDIAYDALLHALVASALSYTTFALLRNSNPYFPMQFHYILRVRDLLLCIPVGIVAGISSHVFLAVLNRLKNFCGLQQIPKLWQYFIGGVLLSSIAFAALTLIGEPASLHSGLAISNRLLRSQYNASTATLIFVAKIFATAITFGMGGVGGMFLPSATIGASLGAVCDYFFMPSQPGLLSLVGIAAFTGASYNSLLFSVVFIAEASGNPALIVPGLIASSTAFLISSGFSNSPSQKFRRP